VLLPSRIVTSAIEQVAEDHGCVGAIVAAEPGPPVALDDGRMSQGESGPARPDRPIARRSHDRAEDRSPANVKAGAAPAWRKVSAPFA
jgi:hypothetical protein